MELKKNNSNENMEQILLEILTGLRNKFFQPLINENRRLTSTINKINEKQEKVFSELQERIERLEKKIEENPVTVLSAIRDAINQSYGGSENGSN